MRGAAYRQKHLAAGGPPGSASETDCRFATGVHAAGIGGLSLSKVCNPARSGCPPLTEFHHRAGIFSLSFQGLVAAGMPSCKPKNRTACANKNEYRGRVLRGSDRSAHSRLCPNCCFGQVIRKPQNNYGRSSQAPRRASEHVRSKTCGPSTRRQHQH
jgi:hypothetical protein